MLTSASRNCPARRQRQAGVVMIIALIALVIMTLAALGMIRSVDTGNLIAGNMAFQQAATHSGDSGIEDAITWLELCNTTPASCATSAGLINNDTSRGYFAAGNGANPTGNQTWNDFWQANFSSVHYGMSQQSGTHNDIAYVIHRMCSNTGSPTSGGACTYSPAVNAASGDGEEAGQIQLNAPSSVYYRITVRISGPRNSVSYVQAMVSL